jgi:hypothetical protein
MKLKYLLTMRCDETGYWDTSGYCHWSKDSYHVNSEFDIDDEESLINAIAYFVEEYPSGEYDIYVIRSYREWDQDEFEWIQDDAHEQKMYDIQNKAVEKSKKIAEQKHLQHIEKQKLDREKEKDQQRERELKQLETLKAKYQV